MKFTELIHAHLRMDHYYFGLYELTRRAKPMLKYLFYFEILLLISMPINEHFSLDEIFLTRV